MINQFKGIIRLSSRTVPPVSSKLVFLATIGVTQAQDLYADIDYPIDQSRSQFTKTVDTTRYDSSGMEIKEHPMNVDYISDNRWLSLLINST